jgi:hypothetical protein
VLPDGGRFFIGGGSWETEGYEDAASRYLITVGAGVSDVRVERY